MMILTITSLFIGGVMGITLVYRKGTTGGNFNMSLPLSGNINWHGCSRACYGKPGCAGFFYRYGGGCRLCFNKEDGVVEVTKWVFWAPVIKRAEDGKKHPSTTPTPVTQMSLEEECDNVGFIFKPFNMCIKFYEQTHAKKWISASVLCQEQGAQLIKLNTKDMMKQIRQYIQSDERLRTSTFYIGAHDIDSNGKWQWEDEDELDVFDYQIKGNLYGGGKCMNLKPQFGHHWNKGDCSYPQGFICERHDII